MPIPSTLASSTKSSSDTVKMPFKLSLSRLLPPFFDPRIRQETLGDVPRNAVPTRTTLQTRIVRFARFLRPRRSTGLSGIKMMAVVVGQVGSAAPVPMIQPIADGVKKIVEHCETARMHKKECMELKDLVLKYVDMLEMATEGTCEEKMDPHLAYALAELDDELLRIHTTMQELSRKGVVKRIISATKDAGLLAKHRQSLQDALTRFQTRQSIQLSIDTADIVHQVQALKLAGRRLIGLFF
ncbi:hypothetical protein L226DRAFT_563401 [Lentinus tigrinus ALCF2SS1-7]|uniref:Uncharacterized protein n=1 Tax=Lentinus tigrinus ALCF2SS1-6 TaxID=1328759 RepID=A0A5C2RUW5_9APHY|nr:hypothetical protein L227DRAFT_604025 [Lentinus tigrinus ALCF2SS1-6]RPD69333.1 hypothetical protein L226DRAFT_563401 [Lentinus tigrinus ALCF2SS1-7]